MEIISAIWNADWNLHASCQAAHAGIEKLLQIHDVKKKADSHRAKTHLVSLNSFRIPCAVTFIAVRERERQSERFNKSP